MPKYLVRLETTASATVTVEAADKDAAYDAALEITPGQLCAHCSGGSLMSKPYSVDIGEYDLIKDQYHDGKLETAAIEEIDEP